jgi:quercetin dioxygenase-like cupin family protein
MHPLKVLGSAIIFLAALVLAQSGQQTLFGKEPIIRTAHQNTFKPSSVLPDCYTYAVEQGDPTTGASVTLSKLAAGCKVPWHTHSANAHVLFVSGKFQLEMKRQPLQLLTQGSYAYVPANHQHEESCLDACTYYVVRDGVTDVHYLDATGKELSPEAALAAVGEHPGGISSGAR